MNTDKNLRNMRRSEEHTSELQSLRHLVCRLLLEKKKKKQRIDIMESGMISATGLQRHVDGHDARPSVHYRSCSQIVDLVPICFAFFFFFNDTATTEIYTLSLHDALPIWRLKRTRGSHRQFRHPGKGMIVTVPGQLGKDVPVGTLRAILRSAGLEGKGEDR